MKFHLTPPQSRLAAAGILLAVLGSLGAAIAIPVWWLHKHYDTYLEDYSDRLTRYRRVAALRPAVEEAIAGVEERASRKFYLKSASPTLAAAELQGLVTRIMETNKGRIISSQIQSTNETAKDDAKSKGPAKVTILVQMNASMVPLQLILHAVESAEPYLFIDQFTVRAHHGRGYKPVPGIQPEFAVQMTISGYTPTDGDKQ